MSNKKRKKLPTDTTNKTDNSPQPLESSGGTSLYPQPDKQRSQDKLYRKVREAPIWIEASCAIAIVIITAFYTYYASQQAGAAIKGANAAQNAADVSRSQLEMSERPWISMREISIDEPLRFDSRGALMSTKHVLRNTGHSPGLHVKWRSQLTTVDLYKGVDTDISSAQDALCQRVRNSSPMLENTIFPEDQIAQSDGIDLPARYIDAALEERGHQPAVFRGSITLALVACIDYQFSFAPGHHQTRYAFWVGVPGPSGWWNGNIKPEGVPAGIALRLSGQSAD